MTEEYHTVDCDRACHGTCKMTATPAETPAPTKWEADHMGLCDHGINHRGERHGCDGCCKRAPVARDASGDAPVLDDERKLLCDKINEWKRRYFLVADAVAAESQSAEQLVDTARQIRADLAAANEEIARLKQAALDELIIRGDILRQRETAHAATTAKLARAVDILDDLNRRGGLGYETHERIRAVLADADSTQAAAAWRELEAVYLACMGISFRDSLPRLHAALAAVDARRGGGR